MSVSKEFPPAGRRSDAWICGVLALATIVVAHVPHDGPLHREEARYADIAAEMLRTGDWIVPRLSGVLYFEKPPLLAWLGALLMPWDSGSGAILRWVPALTSLACCAALAAAARGLGGARLALSSAALYSVMPMTWVFAQTFSTDGPFSDALTIAFCCMAIDRARGRGSLGTTIACGLALAFASLVRSPVLTAVLFVPGAIALGIPGSLVKRCLRAAAPLTIGLALAAPWFIAIQSREPSFFEEFFVNHHLGRAAATEREKNLHREPIYFYAPILVLGLGLLTVPALYAAVHGWTRRAREVLAGPLLTAAWILVAFSLLAGKREPYILPVYPWLALALAWTWLQSEGDVKLRTRLGWTFVPGAVAAAILAITYFALVKFDPPIAGMELSAIAMGGAALATFGPVFLVRRQRGYRAIALCGAGLALAQLCIASQVPWIQARQAEGSVPDSRPKDTDGDYARIQVSFAGRSAGLTLDSLGISGLCQYIDSVAKPGDRIANHGRYRHGLDFYAGRSGHVFATPGELAFGLDAARDDPAVRERFHAERDLANLWNTGPRWWILGEVKDFFVSKDPPIPPSETPVKADKAPYVGMTLYIHRRVGRYMVFTNQP